jgi:hypothetical protein
MADYALNWTGSSADAKVNFGTLGSLNLSAFTMITLAQTNSLTGISDLCWKSDNCQFTQQTGASRAIDFIRWRATQSSADTVRPASLGTQDAGEWWWRVIAYDSTLSSGTRGQAMGKDFTDGSTIAVAATSGTGTGTIDSTASADFIVGNRTGADRPWGSGYAFAGLLSGKLSAAQVQAVIDDMASQSWILAMRVNSDGTVTDHSSNAYTGTKSGTFGSLITTAPDYWTGASEGPTTQWRNVKLATQVARHAALW